MTIQTIYSKLGTIGTLADRLQPIFALVTRWYVGWAFLKSGYLKISDWSQTVDLFAIEYHVPLLPPLPAAIIGTAGELVFSILVIAGLGGRLAPLGLLAVNAMAVISYSHVLLVEGGEVGLAQHILWGFMLCTLIVYGMGTLSLDHLFGRSKPLL